MSKKKDTKALFEVLSGSKAKRPLGVPGWFGQPGSTSAPYPPVEPAPAEAPPEPPPGEGDPKRESSRLGTPDQAEPRPLRPAKVSEPIVSISGGRVRFSFNQVSAVVVVIGLVAIVLVAYVLGRKTRPGDGYNAPFKPDVLDVDNTSSGVLPVPGGPRRTSPAQPAGGALETVKREKGADYLVIQGGVYNLAEAQDIQRFLHGKGVTATIEKQLTRFYIVKDTRPWRETKSKQARQELGEYVKMLTKLGQEYQQQGGKYSFRQGNPERPWLQTEN